MVVRDFLPFVKQVFETLFKAQPVQAVAVSTMYALKQNKTLSTTLSGSILSSKLNLGMELDDKVLAEPLRSVAASVFEEMERESLQIQVQPQDKEQYVVPGDKQKL